MDQIRHPQMIKRLVANADGVTNAQKSSCWMFKLSDINKERVAFINSEVGKKYA